jgi:hypothetical protein
MAFIIDQETQETREVHNLEQHFHTREIWFGNGVVENSLTPYTATSGNGDFDGETLLIDSTDTPVITGNNYFDFHRLLITATSEDTPFYIMLAWGYTGTVVNAISQNRTTVIPIISLAASPFSNGAPFEVKMPKLRSGTKVWALCKNVTNLATVNFFIGLHEYEY